MRRRPFIVAIDGPAGAGKSTVSRLLARRLGYSLVDTGAIYRCAALIAWREEIPIEEEGALAEVLRRMDVTFKMIGEENRVFLSGEDVSAEIRMPQISMLASRISSLRRVREELLPLQRRLALASEKGAILEGRDIGTVVFPDADVKFFLNAADNVRARRRYEELFQKGVESSLEQVLADQTKRDRDDASRKWAPLRPADDAIQLDSSLMPISEVVQSLERTIREKMGAQQKD